MMNDHIVLGLPPFFFVVIPTFEVTLVVPWQPSRLKMYDHFILDIGWNTIDLHYNVTALKWSSDVDIVCNVVGYEEYSWPC